MSGLLKPTKGEIFFEDYKYSSLSEEEIDKMRATNFGFIFQKITFNWSPKCKTKH